MSLQDLKEYQKRSTPEQRHNAAVKAGIASGIARQKRKLIRETLSTMLSSQVSEERLRELLEDAGYDATHQNAIALAAIMKAERGDIEAAKYIRDTIGERPSDQINLGLLTQPIQAMDLSQLTDEELEVLADRCTQDEYDT